MDTTLTEPLRAILYCRVSKDHKKLSRSVTEQEVACREVCEDNGWIVVDVKTDNDIGASPLSLGTRGAWAEVMEEIRLASFDVLVTWEMSRLTRDTVVFAQLRQEMKRSGILLHTDRKTWNFENHNDHMMFGFLGEFSELEAIKIGERTRRAAAANARDGKPHGRCPFGYVRIYDDDTGAIISQDEEPTAAAVVVGIFEDFLAGNSVRSIAHALNDEGVPTPTGKDADGNPGGKWRTIQVRRVIDNPAYAGRRSHKGTITKATWPAIIEPAKFDRAQALRAHQAKHNPTPAGSVPRLLTSVGRCAVCSEPIRSGKHMNRRVYQCSGRSHCVVRDATKLDEYIGVVIVKYLKRPTVLAALNEVTEEPPAVAKAKAEIARLQALNAENNAARIAGHIDMATYVEMNAAIKAQIAEQAKLADWVPTATPELDVPSTGVKQWWEAIGPQRRKDIVNALIEVLVIDRTQQGTRTLDTDAIEITWRI